MVRVGQRSSSRLIPCAALERTPDLTLKTSFPNDMIRGYDLTNCDSRNRFKPITCFVCYHCYQKNYFSLSVELAMTVRNTITYLGKY